MHCHWHAFQTLYGMRTPQWYKTDIFKFICMVDYVRSWKNLLCVCVPDGLDWLDAYVLYSGHIHKLMYLISSLLFPLWCMKEGWSDKVHNSAKEWAQLKSIWWILELKFNCDVHFEASEAISYWASRCMLFENPACMDISMLQEMPELKCSLSKVAVMVAVWFWGLKTM